MYAATPLIQKDLALTLNYFPSFLRSILFCLARRICDIVEEENSNLKQLPELKTLKQQNYLVVLLDNV